LDLKNGLDFYPGLFLSIKAVPAFVARFHDGQGYNPDLPVLIFCHTPRSCLFSRMTYFDEGNFCSSDHCWIERKVVAGIK